MNVEILVLNLCLAYVLILHMALERVRSWPNTSVSTNSAISIVETAPAPSLVNLDLGKDAQLFTGCEWKSYNSYGLETQRAFCSVRKPTNVRVTLPNNQQLLLTACDFSLTRERVSASSKAVSLNEIRIGWNREFASVDAGMSFLQTQLGSIHNFTGACQSKVREDALKPHISSRFTGCIFTPEKAVTVVFGLAATSHYNHFTGSSNFVFHPWVEMNWTQTMDSSCK